jgi:hypothetical protein
VTHFNQSAIRFVSAAFLSLVSAALAGAQCYQFSGSGATLKIDISGFNLSSPPVGAGGGKAASYLFSSTNSLTIGQSTQSSNSVFDGAIDIEFFPPAILQPSGFTQFQIVVPDATQVVTPRSGAHSWQAVLYGVGDLLPNGIVACQAQQLYRSRFRRKQDPISHHVVGQVRLGCTHRRRQQITGHRLRDSGVRRLRRAHQHRHRQRLRARCRLPDRRP